ncbi:MAG: hypothetical protein INR65_16110 [Gluconacetobacter diazotrophicus]|nr:hypothetical protein [Gluconacetobacter diazotrophicus]
MPAPDTIAARVSAARAGTHPQLVGRLLSGWLFLGDVQPLRGYCVLVADPIVPGLEALPEADRARYLLDTVRVGDALRAAFGAHRINYETWCNLDPSLHTHITPRYADEPDALRVLPPRQAYDWSARLFDPARDVPTIAILRAALDLTSSP